MSMTRVLFIHSDRRSAKKSFEWTLETLKWLPLNGIFASHSNSQLYIHVGEVRYEFVSIYNLDNHVLGKEFDGVIVEDSVSLTDDQKHQLRVRLSKNKNIKLWSVENE